MPSWLVPAVGQLSPPRFVSWKTTTKKKTANAANKWQAGLYVVHTISTLGTAGLLRPDSVPALNRATPQTENGCRWKEHWLVPAAGP